MLSNISILGTGSFLPKKVLTNDDLALMVDTSDEWIRQRAGILSRHVCESETNLHMATEAAKDALVSAEVSADEIGLIIVATSTQDYVMPSLASELQAKLGAGSQSMSCPAFDIAAACSGFVYAVEIAKQFLQNNAVQKVLIVASERMSRVLDWSDRTTCVLFGDGAGALILGKTETFKQSGLLSSVIYSDGRWRDMLSVRNALSDELFSEHFGNPYLKMEGRQVFKKAVSILSGLTDELLQKAEIEQVELDWFVPHQANYRIIEATAKKLCLPMSQVVMTLTHHGNTSAASIPLALDEAIKSGKIVRGQTILMEAFGAGIVWGGCIFRY